MKSLREQIHKPQYNNDFSQVLLGAEEHFFNLHERHGKKWHLNWGGYLFDGKSYEYCIDMYDKQKLIYDVVKTKNSALEIGTYVGHSLLLMLLANPKLEVTCIDISDEYAKPSIDYLREAFPQANIEFIHRSSLDALPTINKKYDMFHIDGTHKNKLITEEFHKCLEKRNSNAVSIIFDDVSSCQKLIKQLEENMNIIESNTPGCYCSNAYYKFKI
jgi:hypothetical protein